MNLNAHELHISSSKDKEFIYAKIYHDKNLACKECEVEILTKNKHMKYKTDAKGVLKIPLKLNPIRITAQDKLGRKRVLNLDKNKKTQSTQVNIPIYIKILGAIFIIFSFIVGFRWNRK